ncbi:MAG: hypothetical protein IPH44_13400 [Myxococcales bacterium]|nr:hypothetical protein [Myxococcales bacterium]MBP6848951.1 hypothetical protein [Kofleriaceae bacterium]
MSPRLLLAALACTLAPSLALAEQPTPEPAPAPAPPPPPSDEPAPPADPTADQPPRATVETTSFDAGEVRTLAAGESIDVRSYAKDWLVAPPGYNIGGELRFITASTSPDGPRVRFTDLALLRLQTRWTASRRIELSGSVDLLAKQPDSRKDIFIQGGGLGVKIATSKANAIAAGVAGGPTMGDDGFWGSVGTGVIHRSRIEQFLAFQYGGGASATGLRMGDDPAVWQAGLAASSELVFHTPRGEFATWLGFDLELPVVHSDALDPRSRLGVTVGMVFAAVKDWDLYTTFSWRDRGTTDLPATTLPIIDGGFDQKQFAVGLTRRFSVRGKSAKWALAL